MTDQKDTLLCLLLLAGIVGVVTILVDVLRTNKASRMAYSRMEEAARSSIETNAVVRRKWLEWRREEQADEDPWGLFDPNRDDSE